MNCSMVSTLRKLSLHLMSYLIFCEYMSHMMSFSCFSGITFGLSFALFLNSMFPLKNFDLFLFFFLGTTSLWISAGIWRVVKFVFTYEFWIIVWKLLIYLFWAFNISWNFWFCCSIADIFRFSSLIYKSLRSWLAWTVWSSHRKRAAVLPGSFGSSKCVVYCTLFSWTRLKCASCIYWMKLKILVKMDSRAKMTELSIFCMDSLVLS